MWLSFSDNRISVYTELFPSSPSVNCPNISKRLREKVRCKEMALYRNINCLVHHDNAPTDTAISVRNFSVAHTVRRVLAGTCPVRIFYVIRDEN